MAKIANKAMEKIKYVGYAGYVVTVVLIILLFSKDKHEHTWVDFALCVVPAGLSLILHRPPFIERLLDRIFPAKKE